MTYGTYIEELAEFSIGDHAVLPGPKIHIHKGAIQIERDLLLQGGLLDDVGKLVKGDDPIPMGVKEPEGGGIQGIRSTAPTLKCLELGERDEGIFGTVNDPTQEGQGVWIEVLCGEKSKEFSDKVI